MRTGDTAQPSRLPRQGSSASPPTAECCLSPPSPPGPQLVGTGFCGCRGLSQILPHSHLTAHLGPEVRSPGRWGRAGRPTEGPGAAPSALPHPRMRGGWGEQGSRSRHVRGTSLGRGATLRRSSGFGVRGSGAALAGVCSGTCLRRGGLGHGCRWGERSRVISAPVLPSFRGEPFRGMTWDRDRPSGSEFPHSPFAMVPGAPVLRSLSSHWPSPPLPSKDPPMPRPPAGLPGARLRPLQPSPAWIQAAGVGTLTLRQHRCPL